MMIALDCMAVAPEHQRKGIATLLLKSGLVQADTAAITTYISSTSMGRKLYEKQGFQAVRTVTYKASETDLNSEDLTAFYLRHPPAKIST
jgi:GNAT superfamily N-acetyltransferase